MGEVECVRALLKVTLGDREPGGVDPDAVRVLTSLSRRAWRAGLERVRDNRLAAPLGYGLVRAGLLGSVPEPFRSQLDAAQEAQRAHNELRFAEFVRFQARLEELGIDPVLLKSSALSAMIYPQQAANQMGDLDIYVPPERAEETTRVLADMGYERGPVDTDAVDYLDASGKVRIDLHWSFRLFEHMNFKSLWETRPGTFPGVERVTVLRANPMLSHLVYHLNAHRPSFGYQLRWLLDVGFVLQHYRDEFDYSEVERMLPVRADRCNVLRVVEFFRTEFGLLPPPGLAKIAAGVPTFTLAETLRSQRFNPWPLSGPRGWLRWGACMLGIRELDYRRSPRVTDLHARLADRKREEAALRLTP